MIIEAPYKEGDVVSIKTIASEEIVGRLVEETETYIILNKPLAFMMGPQGLGLVPYMFSAPQDAKIKVKDSAIASIVKTEQAVAKQYTQQTSGIMV